MLLHRLLHCVITQATHRLYSAANNMIGNSFYPSTCVMCLRSIEPVLTIILEQVGLDHSIVLACLGCGRALEKKNNTRLEHCMYYSLMVKQVV